MSELHELLHAPHCYGKTYGLSPEATCLQCGAKEECKEKYEKKQVIKND